jgi:hypothetical protein
MIDDSSESFADKIRRAVRSTGRSTCAIAAASGIAQPVLSRFLSRQRGITLETAEKLCRTLRLSLQPQDTRDPGR